MIKEKGLFQKLQEENKKRFGVKIAFNAVSGHVDTLGICTYEDIKDYSRFKVDLDFGDYEKSSAFNKVEEVMNFILTSGCKKAKVTVWGDKQWNITI